MSRKKVNLYQFSASGSQVKRIADALELLELAGIAGSFSRSSEEAVRNHKTPLDYLEGLLEKEVLLKEESRILRWIAQARFPWHKTLKEFDFDFQPSIDQTLIYELASARFVMKGGNVLFHGPPGVGKTHLSIALGIEVIHQGYDVRFIVLNQLIDLVLKCGQDIIRTQRLLATLFRPKVLILDDIDHYKLSEDTTEFLFKLVIYRYDHELSTIFTSNKHFDDWEPLFGQKARAAVAIDRITQRAEVISIDGISYRLKDKYSAYQEKHPAPTVV